MRKILGIIIVVSLVSGCFPAFAQEDGLSFVRFPASFVPGSISPIVFTSPAEGPVKLEVIDLSGNTAAVISQSYEAHIGENALGWDGTYYGEALKEGAYILRLSSAAETISADITIGGALPMFTQVYLSDTVVTVDHPLNITLSASMPADLTVIVTGPDGAAYPLGSGTLSETPATMQWDGRTGGQSLPDGDYTLELTLKENATGNIATIEYIDLTIANGGESASASVASDTPMQASILPHDFTPAYPSEHTCTHENCYWNTPMDITNEKAVWDMLMAPMWVINTDQKKQVKMYAEPDDASEAIAVITGASQSVHVLENLDNGWSLVETYSSSFHDSAVKAWNVFSTGYIKTNLLVEKSPGNKEFAMVVDKLTQRLYLFRDGKMIAELLCSTGLANQKQPYNETRSGEFFLISAVGEFKSDNLRCSFGIRFNSGDLLHEVPHLDNADGTNNYRNTEPKLGTRASHGCIRIQRLKNPDGINMRWIWDNIYRGIASKTVKFVVWEDYQGRQIPLPDPDAKVYYNPDGGANYHARETCQGVKDKYLPLSSFPYSEFETDRYAKLTPCQYCAPLRRVAEINAINEAHQGE